MGASGSTLEKKKKSYILYDSIVRIESTFKGEQFIGNGFFIKLSLKSNMKYFLMTCCHIIKERFVEEKINIKLYYVNSNEEKEIIINLDKDERFIKCFEKPIDVTLIEIIEKDKIKEDKFLLPDLNYKNGFSYYKNNYIYLVSYPKIDSNKNERNISSGQIINILNKSEFEHSIHGEYGNSGSPICLVNNLLIVGINKEDNKSKQINYGTFIGYILDNIDNEMENNDKCLHKTKLLKNIKSKYIINILFSYMDEKIKLKIIKYNKFLKRVNNINLINYKYLLRNI